MVSLEQRRKDIFDLIDKLDISPAMYKNAVEKYKNITTYLEQHGVNAVFYPQGSFALGTVVRPYAKDKECAYDLDFICQLKAMSKENNAKEVKESVGEILESSDLYDGKLTEYDECYKIEYAEINNVGFSMDIVPSVDEDEEKKVILKSKCKNPELIETAIAIPSQNKWLTNNPKGYKEWFDSINEPFKRFNRETRRRVLYESAKAIYASVEDVPEGLERSSLQRVIQIFKHHRNVYFANKPNSTKPLSAIITTLAAQIAKSAPNHYGVFELLDFIAKELAVYSKHQNLNEAVFKSSYPSKEIITRNAGKWKIENPANPEDNLASEWNENNTSATDFFNWVSIVTKDLISSLFESDEKFKSSVESAFGFNFASKNVDLKKYNKSIPTSFTPGTQKSPWSACNVNH